MQLDLFRFRIPRSLSTLVMLVAGPAWGSVSPAKIYFQGTLTGDTPITVTVGQQIYLFADLSGDTESWSLSPSTIVYGTFAPVNAPSCPTYPAISNGICVDYGSIDFTSSSTAFYFFQSGTFKTTYKYTLKGESASSFVTFRVVAPTNTSVRFNPQPLPGPLHLVPADPCPASTNCYLALGNYIKPNHQPGIIMDATTTEPRGFPGKFTWLQTIDWEPGYTDSQGTHVCPVWAGLDGKYPSPGESPGSGTPTKFSENVDAPYGRLVGTQFTDDFAAQIVLLWTPNETKFVLHPVPVVLGYGSWGFDASVSVDQNTKNWGIDYSTIQTPAFTPGFAAPGYNSVVELPKTFELNCPVQ